jgi:HlyD family secretion protein
MSQVRLGALELNNVVTYTVIIEADNDDRRLLPGMTANAKIESAKLDQALRIPVDALRFRPRASDMAAATQHAFLQHIKQEIERARTDLKLTVDQYDKVNAAMRAAAGPEPPSGAAAAATGGQRPQPSSGETEGRMLQRLKYALAGVATEAQRAAFEAWKSRIENGAARTRREVTVWVLTPGGQLESRPVRLGLIDDDFAEVVGDGLRDGDRVVLRSRETGKK